jgi:hypothetical protein
MGCSSNNVGESLSTDKTMPVTVLILFSVTHMSRIAELLLSRCIVLRFHRLRNAVEAVQEVEHFVNKHFVNNECDVYAHAKLYYDRLHILFIIFMLLHNRSLHKTLSHPL